MIKKTWKKDSESPEKMMNWLYERKKKNITVTWIKNHHHNELCGHYYNNNNNKTTMKKNSLNEKKNRSSKQWQVFFLDFLFSIKKTDNLFSLYELKLSLNQITHSHSNTHAHQKNVIGTEQNSCYIVEYQYRIKNHGNR